MQRYSSDVRDALLIFPTVFDVCSDSPFLLGTGVLGRKHSMARAGLRATLNSSSVDLPGQENHGITRDTSCQHVQTLNGSRDKIMPVGGTFTE